MIVLGALVAVIFVGGIVIKWFGYKKRNNPPLHRVLSRLGKAEIYVGLIGALLYFFSYEQISLVSARFWWILLAAMAIVWKTYIVIDIMKRYPIEKKALADRLAKEKYLPK